MKHEVGVEILSNFTSSSTSSVNFIMIIYQFLHCLITCFASLFIFQFFGKPYYCSQGKRHKLRSASCHEKVVRGAVMCRTSRLYAVHQGGNAVLHDLLAVAVQSPITDLNRYIFNGSIKYHELPESCIIQVGMKLHGSKIRFSKRL